MEQLLKFYDDYKEKVNAYRLALTTMYFDQATIAPKNGAAYANKMSSILAGEAFSFETNPDSIKKIEELYQKCEDPILKKELRLRLKDLEEVRVLPKDVYVSYHKCLSDSETAWHEAKTKKDYSLFKPHLKSVFEKQLEVLSYGGHKEHAYDVLLDRYQEGMKQKTYDSFFQKIKEQLLPFIQEISKHQEKINDDLFHQSYDLKQQEAFMQDLLSYLQVNPNTCHIALSEHPFTEEFSSQDARITTHYYEDNLMSAILSTIHEYGHALFGLQVNKDFEGTTLSHDIGMALHESQSRLMENHIGKHPAFWKANFPKLKTYFPQLNDLSFDSFIQMIHVSRPSLIRTEADELTYPIHILIRYELEKELFEGKIDLDRFDKIWADRYEAYLGIRPMNDAEGILQDTHWSTGAFGYFPTYAYGSAVAAQLYHQMQKDLDLDSILTNAQFEKIAEWLKDHIHQYGALKTIDELLVETTNEPFNPDYYINYLIEKYTKIYTL